MVVTTTPAAARVPGMNSPPELGSTGEVPAVITPRLALSPDEDFWHALDGFKFFAFPLLTLESFSFT